MHYNRRMLGDEGADLASASSAALDKERYAVHAIPIVDTKGYIYVKMITLRGMEELTSWNCIGINRKLMI